MRILKVLCLICALAVILSFSAFAATPVIVSQPQNYYFPANATFPAQARFSILASGENLSYQWQYRSARNPEWTNFGSTTFSTVNVTVSQSNLNRDAEYRCVVSNSDGQVVSSVASVSVAAYLMDSIPQMLSWISEVCYSIFGWVSQSFSYIVSEPLFLFTVGFLAVGACVALVSRLLARS